mgnify:CR=1 FL=1
MAKSEKKTGAGKPAPHLIKAHKGGRVKQFHCRLTESELAEVKAKVKADGYKSEADWLMAQVRRA